MNVIPVVMTSNEYFAAYASVTVVSILENANENTIYDFYFLISNDFLEDSKRIIVSEIEKYYRHKINFIYAENTFKHSYMAKPLGKEVYYRLQACELLPEKYDFCICLDVDLVVNCDLSEMYETRFKMAGEYGAGYLVAGVRDPWICLQTIPDEHYKEYGIPSLDQYINAGVLIMNLKLMREMDIFPIFLEESRKDRNKLLGFDQNIINKVCFNKIYPLNLKYNFCPVIVSDKRFHNRIFLIFGQDEIKEAQENPYIIHYAGYFKPWYRGTDLFWSSFWWHYARKTYSYEKIIMDISVEIARENTNNARDEIRSYIRHKMRFYKGAICFIILVLLIYAAFNLFFYK
ncbi:MAG: glycosyltransferase family 8 protein [Elusimicrobiota bacterium]|jgi:lipopolysaccharide biosynthesis glycosyltransferase|nr:glycosyltransferase family 8 protein [Elusimicrobiota bacterium]